MTNVIIACLLSAVVSLGVVVAYDYLVLTPKIADSAPVVADIDRLLSVQETKVKNKEIDIDTYRKRVRAAEEIINSYRMVVNKNFPVIDGIRPVVFGGRDITGEVLERMEAVK